MSHYFSLAPVAGNIVYSLVEFMVKWKLAVTPDDVLDNQKLKKRFRRL